MSKEAAAKFMDQLVRDPALRKKLNEQIKVKQATEKTVRFAKRRDYDFSWEELREVLREKWATRKAKDFWDEYPFFTALSETPRF